METGGLGSKPTCISQGSLICCSKPITGGPGCHLGPKQEAAIPHPGVKEAGGTQRMLLKARHSEPRIWGEAAASKALENSRHQSIPMQRGKSHFPLLLQTSQTTRVGHPHSRHLVWRHPKAFHPSFPCSWMLGPTAPYRAL